MNKTHFYIILSLVVGFSIGLLLNLPKPEKDLGLTIKSTDTGVFVVTSTSYTLKNKYGGSVRVDKYGRLILSPSSTINIIGE